MSISRNQLRAARVLLCLSQEELAALANVGVTTIRRYETGAGLSAQKARTLRAAVEAAGAVIIEGQDIGGRRIGHGVALVGDDELPPETRKRITDRLEEDPESAPRGRGRPRKRGIPAPAADDVPPEGSPAED